MINIRRVIAVVLIGTSVSLQSMEWPSLSELNAKLLRGVVQGKVEDVETALTQGAQINFRRGLSGLEALHIAAEAGRAPIVEALIDYGASVNARSGSGRTALSYAVSSRNPDLLFWLIQHGAETKEESPATMIQLHGIFDRNPLLHLLVFGLPGQADQLFSNAYLGQEEISRELSPEEKRMLNNALLLAVGRQNNTIALGILKNFPDILRASTVQEAFLTAVRVGNNIVIYLLADVLKRKIGQNKAELKKLLVRAMLIATMRRSQDLLKRILEIDFKWALETGESAFAFIQQRLRVPYLTEEERKVYEVFLEVLGKASHIDVVGRVWLTSAQKEIGSYLMFLPVEIMELVLKYVLAHQLSKGT